MDSSVSVSIHFKARILIVDDLPENRTLLSEWLTNFGCSVIEAENGREALVSIRQQTPDLILTDIKMPVMDGRELVKVLKFDEKLKKIPVIAVTAYAVTADVNKNPPDLFDDYIRKPVTSEVLVAKLMPFVEDIGSNPMESETDIDPAARQKLAEMETALLEEWAQINESFFLDEIEDFAKKIKELGRELPVEALFRWGENLYRQARIIDMKDLPRTLSEFPELLAALKRQT
jgi:CheY-like chemotaxis protein